MKFRVVYIFVFSMLCSAAFLQAQDNVPKTAEGDKALLFTINGFGDFGVRGTNVGSTVGQNAGDTLSIDGQSVYGIGVKYFFQPRTAVRLGLGLNFSSRSAAGSSESTGSSSLFAIMPAIEHHIIQAGPMSVYTGGFVSFATRSQTTGPSANASTNSSSGLAVGGILGVEFFAWNRISLGAEYQLGVTFGSTSSKSGGTTTSGPSSMNLGISLAAVRLEVFI